ncbi:MAG: 16S rRNA (guanine(527)-N(7))-methyltransferase RsmG [Egibacteraceae bacterium]
MGGGRAEGGPAGDDGVPEPTPAQAAALDRLAVQLAASPHNLVARGERATVRERHIAECLALVPLLGTEPGQAWVDLGTGGGLPGLVLAIMVPAVEWTLIDATRKKVAWVRTVAEDLGLDNVTGVAGRAETLAHEPQFRERFDGVVSRAVAEMATLVELSRGFVRPGGTVAAIKGPRWADEVERAQTALGALRLEVVHTAVIASLNRPSWLVTMRAMGPAPSAYPRREGRPRSHPLGGTRR